ncbi:hypothetical protein ACOBQX_26175 [Actinokineospora sp. G85]|uniref:hypothetical protein n=1 Tax=Actinokineospora sp. G85 TaxID=3406626 RepID=UPI003C71B607
MLEVGQETGDRTEVGVEGLAASEVAGEAVPVLQVSNAVLEPGPPSGELFLFRSTEFGDARHVFERFLVMLLSGCDDLLSVMVNAFMAFWRDLPEVN